MNEPKMTLKECIEQLEYCNYECEAGKLECNVAFRQIKEVVERIEFVFGRQINRPDNVGEYLSKEDLIKIKHGEELINFILTGCNCDSIVKTEFERMGYE